MTWTPAVAVGPSVLLTRDFAAMGFSIGVGFRHFVLFDPNPSTRGAPLAFATLGLGALPRGALIGNEMGLDGTSRVAWLSGDELFIETALKPAFRVQVADARISVPSVLGTLLPAFGFVTLSADDTAPHASLVPRYEGLLFRWAFGVRYVARTDPVLLFVELEPTLSLVVPVDGAAPSAMAGIGLMVGFTPMQN